MPLDNQVLVVVLSIFLPCYWVISITKSCGRCFIYYTGGLWACQIALGSNIKWNWYKSTIIENKNILVKLTLNELELYVSDTIEAKISDLR